MPQVRRRTNYTQISEFDRGRIAGLRKAGLSFRKIAKRVHKSQDSVAIRYSFRKVEHNESGEQDEPVDEQYAKIFALQRLLLYSKSVLYKT